MSEVFPDGAAQREVAWREWYRLGEDGHLRRYLRVDVWLASEDVCADLALPSVLPGYERRNLVRTEGEGDYTWHFEIVDREIWTAAPVARATYGNSSGISETPSLTTDQAAESPPTSGKIMSGWELTVWLLLSLPVFVTLLWIIWLCLARLINQG